MYSKDTVWSNIGKEENYEKFTEWIYWKEELLAKTFHCFAGSSEHGRDLIFPDTGKSGNRPMYADEPCGCSKAAYEPGQLAGTDEYYFAGYRTDLWCKELWIRFLI